MDNKIKKRKIKISGVLVLLGIFVGLIGLVYIIVSLPLEKTSTNTLYSYTSRKSSTYNVNLNPNVNYFYDNLIGESGNIYPSSAIQNYNLTLTYLYEGSKLENTEYTYYVTADIIGEFNENNSGNTSIWEKKFNLTEPKNNRITNQKSFSINEPVTIDYWNYANIVNEFKSAFSMSINAYLRVRLNVEYKTTSIENEFDEITNKEYVELQIPLSSNVSSVKNNYEPLIENNVTETVFNKPDYVILGIGLFFMFASIILFIIANNKKVVTKHSLYKKNMDKVLKDYGDLIVTVKNRPSIKDLRLMALTNIDDLVDVAEQNKCNIINYEIPKKDESFLLVISGSYVYVYVITEEDINYSNK